MARVQLNVWVTEAERATIKAAAARLGVPVGRLVADSVLGVQEQEGASERLAGLEASFEQLERRLSRLEGMADGSSY